MKSLTCQYALSVWVGSLVVIAESFLIVPNAHRSIKQPSPLIRRSTPFEADFYDDDTDDNPFSQTSSSLLKVDPDTRLVLGLNKYSHDTSICAADARTGEVLFALSKERLSRKKHDGGNAATLVETCLDQLDLTLDNVERAVVNNHHHRVLPLERSKAHLEWECGLRINGGQEDGYDDEENLLSHAQQHELSHHLAHAYSVATQAPFDNGLVVIMDGMGETYRAMRQALVRKDDSYTSDFTLLEDPEDLQLIPSDLAERSRDSPFDWREAESVYVFEKSEVGGIQIRPIFKRFTEEHSPPTLYNHGFENMDSAGALYSRASSHIFGDWNACGKVMGLAPWRAHEWTVEEDSSLLRPKLLDKPIMWGTLYSEETGKQFQVDRSLLSGTPYIARSDPDLFDENMVQKRRYDFDDNDYEPVQSEDSSANENNDERRLPATVALEAIALADRIQVDLEEIIMDFVKHFRDRTGEKNLCLAGGVALNSVLNGRLCRELGFERTFIPPYPGDDGIAVGCCAFGLYGTKEQKTTPPLWNAPLSPYMGPSPTEADIKDAINEALPWLEVDAVRNEDRRLEIMAQEIESGGVVAWYHGRSEMGPRALGHRSILADPRKKGLVRFVNEHVKKRESFRPFAPSVLAEEAGEWFDLGDTAPGDNNVSPYMSLTAYVKEAKRDKIPAVTHVDGSSRLQSVTKDAEPLYHKLISTFFARTGVPMVLNTSFNTLPGEPIVENPRNAIRSFLCSMGSIEMLVMGDYVIKRKQPDLRKLLGQVEKDSDVVTTEPACPKRTGSVSFQSSFSIPDGSIEEEDVQTTTRVKMPDRPMHNERNEWFELQDELEGELLSICDGTNYLNDILGEYTAAPEEETRDMDESEALLNTIVSRLVRLYEHTLISW